MRNFIISMCVVLTLSLDSATLLAATPVYPTKPIRLIVPFTPGGGSDILARVLGQYLSASLKQNVIVDNRAGGNTLIASEIVAHAAPDGHTLLIQANNLTGLRVLAPDNKPTVTADNFVPITLVGVLPHVLVVPRNSRASSVQELIKLAKAAPKSLTYSSAGVGSAVHMGGALLAAMARIELVHVPYKGGADNTTAVVAGQCDMTFGSALTVIPHIRSGALKGLGATTSRRIKTLPDMPTIAESGLPGYDIASWFGLLAPAGTPAAIVNLLQSEIVRALATKEIADRLSDYQLIGNTPAEFSAFLHKDAEMMARLIAQSGAKSD